MKRTTDPVAVSEKLKMAHNSGVPGVRRGAEWIEYGAHLRHVPWPLLDAQLAGLKKRRNRPDVWLGAASQTMAQIRAQTLSTYQAFANGLRIPAWLQDPWLDLLEVERKLLAAVWRAYEVGAGGLYDCQSTIAADLGIGCERTLRSLLNGRKPRMVNRTVGGRVLRVLDKGRAGLVERGLISKRITYAPKPDGCTRPHWLLLRIGPELEERAGLAVFAQPWIDVPRRKGLTRRAALRCKAYLTQQAREHRFAAARKAWEQRNANGRRDRWLKPLLRQPEWQRPEPPPRPGSSEPRPKAPEPAPASGDVVELLGGASDSEAREIVGPLSTRPATSTVLRRHPAEGWLGTAAGATPPNPRTRNLAPARASESEAPPRSSTTSPDAGAASGAGARPRTSARRAQDRNLGARAAASTELEQNIPESWPPELRAKILERCTPPPPVPGTSTSSATSPTGSAPLRDGDQVEGTDEPDVSNTS